MHKNELNLNPACIKIGGLNTNIILQKNKALRAFQLFLIALWYKELVLKTLAAYEQRGTFC
ncbi:MAG: hypothetical protein COT26_01915 [Candidatus Kerfeldbacteria bacterium CG08_land_8_20_14_0_20_43_14]|uniref:Uncharacterized protein n=1 Tax=Candidatus Kerfeldbacteria bacterium CG08_land_8_20_14_0_20_43_14 TaxID=2014246 RepID=A0A2H0YQZ8_9BACT|nr:MAG: hypothetical protein COT26_01915 [Candidatus Kerfeldbacteria bacterium CG08_land_8_20_14_0_20_43_14]